MKVTVSIPDQLFNAAEKLSVQRNYSRSRLYQEALRHYLERETSSAITAKLDEVYAGDSGSMDPVLLRTQMRVLGKATW